MIFNIVILGQNLLKVWCRMRKRPARLVSYAILYTTVSEKIKNIWPDKDSEQDLLLEKELI